MSQEADREALRRALAPEDVQEHEPFEWEGQQVSLTLRPTDGAALAAGIRALFERRIGTLIRGGGSRPGLGNPPRGAWVLLSSEALADVDELDTEEGVAHAGGGTRLAELRERAHTAGWELPLDPPGARATLGGTLAAAALGPRHLGFGRPRDAVLGLEVVLGDGVRARCGGRVVKNVTGYDLAKLHVGALGSLGVIEGAWLRLRPLPESERVVVARFGALERACEQGLAAARLAGARAVALVDAASAAAVEPGTEFREGWLLLAELAGDEPVVARDARGLEEQCGAATASPGALARVRALQSAELGPAAIRFRVAARPARLESAVGPLAAAGAALLVYPGSGLVFASFALGCEANLARSDLAWRAVQAAADASGGGFLVEAGPAWGRGARDAFGPASEELPLWRALKQRFDPAGVLNPGRFAGGL